jgi:hypothetical protein
MSLIRNAAFATAVSVAVLGGTALTTSLTPAFADDRGSRRRADVSIEIISSKTRSIRRITRHLSRPSRRRISSKPCRAMGRSRSSRLSTRQKLPKGTVDNLLKPENKPTLTALLTYHVLPGKISAADFVAAVKKGGGEAMYKTVEGEELTIKQNGRRLEIIDAKGDKSFVTIADVNQKNGVIHVVDTVLLPKS